jgi:hypothetical protein
MSTDLPDLPDVPEDVPDSHGDDDDKHLAGEEHARENRENEPPA